MIVGTLLVHAALAAIVIGGRRWLSRGAFLVAGIGPLTTLALAMALTPRVLDGERATATLSWVPALGLELGFSVDTYALLFLFVIGGAGTAIFAYAHRYFGAGPKTSNFAGTMVLFGGAMVGLVSSDHLLGVFVFWELTTITSYLLIGHADHTASARSAALHAALVTGAGGLAMLGGLLLLGQQAGTMSIAGIVDSPPAASPVVSLAWALVLVGAVTKSAQFPFHGWLPGAMSAPTPASAFLHSATMVKAGIFLVGRLSPAAVAGADWWRSAVLAIGFVTMVLGGWRALRQFDLKLLLAFGTVSQLGFMFLLIGSGTDKLLFGGLALLLGHAMFKATLFMVVGTIDHEAGTRDLRVLDGLRHSMPAVFWVAVAAAASMAAVPLTFGFVAKEAAFHALESKGVWFIAAAALASVLTATYTGRFLIGAFGPAADGYEPVRKALRSPGNALTGAPLVLAGLGLAFGVAPGLVAPLIDGATADVFGVTGVEKLVVWPGLATALAWSLGSLALGTTLAMRPGVVSTVTASVGRIADRLPNADQTFRSSLTGLMRFADRAAGTMQSGSLPAYVAIIASTAVVVPSTALLRGSPVLDAPRAGSVMEAVLALVIVASGVGLVFIRRRFATVILLGGVGYGIAGLYALMAGPDLSITQLLVETLAIALFAFVLRHLPAEFSPARTSRAARAVVGVAVAAFVFVGGLLTLGGPNPTGEVSSQYVERAVPEAGGANVVNVILVDFRGFDTLGEITVLVAATLGASGLVLPLIRRREDST